MSLGTYHLFIFVTADRFTNDDITVFNHLAGELHKPCFLVRTKFDIVLQNATYDGDNRSEKEIRQDIEADIREGVPAHNIEKIYMVSARRPDLFDIPSLLDDLRKSFHGVKRLRLENDLAAWSKKALERKRDNAIQITYWYAAASALNGLNPIPGVNIAVDLGILSKLAQEVAHIYSLTHEQEDFWRGILTGPHAAAIMQRMVALGLKYGTTEAILTILRAIGRSEIPREFARMIPFVGQMVGAGAGFGITYTFGKGLVDEYHKMASDLLDELRAQKGLE